MEFALTVEASEGVANKTYLINNLSDRLYEYFSDKDYGNDVKRILIGTIFVAPEFEWFSKIRKPKYTFYQKYKRDDTEIVADRVFTFDLKIDYESFKNQSDEQNEKKVALKILKILTNFDLLTNKIKGICKKRIKGIQKAIIYYSKIII